MAASNICHQSPPGPLPGAIFGRIHKLPKIQGAATNHSINEPYACRARHFLRLPPPLARVHCLALFLLALRSDPFVALRAYLTLQFEPRESSKGAAPHGAAALEAILQRIEVRHLLLSTGHNVR